jgi:SpoVK/Ycf46/Vps4 family AAA+-type ATPase
MPSALREVYLESPDIPWTEIGGLEEVKRELQEAVEWPLRYPNLYKELGRKLSSTRNLFPCFDVFFLVIIICLSRLVTNAISHHFQFLFD